MLHEQPDGRPTPKPNNPGNIRPKLAIARTSLSPSHFDEAKFDDFNFKNRWAFTEKNVICAVVPGLGGDTDTLNEEGVILTKLRLMTDGNLLIFKPDYFNGVWPKISMNL